MLQSIKLWLPRILALLQWICGLGIAYVIANTILMMVGGGADSSRAVQSPAALTAESRALPPAPTLAALTKRDLFGHTNATNLSRSSAPAVPTRLPLTLEAVFVSSAPEESSAIISERGKRGKLYSPGDQLPGNARLYKVEATQVILERAGAREALAFKSKFQAKASSTAQSARSAAAQAAPTGTTAPLLQQLGTELAQDPDATLERLGVSRNGGGGYRIGNVADNAYLTQSGLQAGDVVLSINGRPLGDINVDRMALTNLANSGSVSVELLRNGQTLTITTRIPETLRR